jgi:hypothetical protein
MVTGSVQGQGSRHTLAIQPVLEGANNNRQNGTNVLLYTSGGRPNPVCHYLLDEAQALIDQHCVDRSAIQGQRLTYGAISGIVDALGDKGDSCWGQPLSAPARCSMSWCPKRSKGCLPANYRAAVIPNCYGLSACLRLQVSEVSERPIRIRAVVTFIGGCTYCDYARLSNRPHSH